MRIRSGELIPDDYIQVEYLESTGSQYIDANYVCKTNNLIFELDMEWTGTNVGAFETFIGFMYSTSQVTPRIGLHKWSSVLMFGANDTRTSGTTPVTNQRFTYKGDFTSGKQFLYKNGTQIASGTTSYNFSTNTCPTYIFARYCPSSMNYAYMKLYEASIWEGTTRVRHFIPCLRVSDGKPGLYDTETKTFIAGQGTKEFLYGEVVRYSFKVSYYKNSTSTIIGCKPR